MIRIPSNDRSVSGVLEQRRHAAPWSESPPMIGQYQVSRGNETHYPMIRIPSNDRSGTAVPGNETRYPMIRIPINERSVSCVLAQRDTRPHDQNPQQWQVSVRFVSGKSNISKTKAKIDGCFAYDGLWSDLLELSLPLLTEDAWYMSGSSQSVNSVPSILSKLLNPFSAILLDCVQLMYNRFDAYTPDHNHKHTSICGYLYNVSEWLLSYRMYIQVELLYIILVYFMAWKTSENIIMMSYCASGVYFYHSCQWVKVLLRITLECTLEK